MNRWLRVAAIVSGAFVGALLMKVLPPILVLAVFVVSAFAITRTMKSRMRSEAVVGEAATLGLRREPSDPFGLLAYPLTLFGRGTDGRVGEVRWGTWRGVEVKAFEYTYAMRAMPNETSKPDAGPRGRLSCAIATISAEGPPIVAEPVPFVLRLAAQAPLDEVDLDAGPVASSFLVRCDDADQARTLVAAVGDWLVEGGEEWGFEVSGRLLMIYGAPTRPPSVADVLGRLDDLRSLLHGRTAAGHVVHDPGAGEPV